jgi:hypothetical protein
MNKVSATNIDNIEFKLFDKDIIQNKLIQEIFLD